MNNDLQTVEDLHDHYRAIEMGGHEFDFSNKQPFALKTLRKVDYMEYVERNGRANLNYFQQNSETVNNLTDRLRSTLHNSKYYY